MASLETTNCMLAIVLLAVSPPAAMQTVSQASAISGLVTSYVSDHQVPGLSLAVIDRGRVILTQGYGLADVENSVPATADTVYRIASISKSITATAAMKLVEAGRLDLDGSHSEILSRLSEEAMANYGKGTSFPPERHPRLQE